MPDFAGFDHIDVRVSSLALVEPFYDLLLPELGLVKKTFAYVDADGDWHVPGDSHPYNAVEYHQELRPGEAEYFIGFIEDPKTVPVATRIALRVASPEVVLSYEAKLRHAGARSVERSADFGVYPAVFFEDPAGTHLELCAREPKLLERHQRFDEARFDAAHLE